MKSVLITGGAGFIGYSLIITLLQYSNFKIYTFDNYNNYYDVQLKKDRAENLHKLGVDVINFDLKNNTNDWLKLFPDDIDIIIHLAAQAGVRYSLENPQEYIRTNIEGFVNVLEFAKLKNVKQVIYASSSSVYGNATQCSEDNIDLTQESVYAVSKRTDELLAKTYYNLYGINSIGLRFFTVYGPWGRPDMMHYKILNHLYKGTPLTVYNNGQMYRDFTYIDDITLSIYYLLLKQTEGAEIYNIGKGSPTLLKDLLTIFEEESGKKINATFETNMAKGDVYKTNASVANLINKTGGYIPSVDDRTGIKLYIDWYKEYNNII